MTALGWIACYTVLGFLSGAAARHVAEDLPHPEARRATVVCIGAAWPLFWLMVADRAIAAWWAKKGSK